MVQRDLDLPTSACRSSTGGRPSLGRASPRHQQLPALHFILCCPPWCLYPTSCYKGSVLINNIKNHKETTVRVSRRLEETLET